MLWDGSVSLKRASDGLTTATCTVKHARGVLIQTSECEIWLVILPDHQNHPSSKAPPQPTVSLKQWTFAIHLLEGASRRGASRSSCPSVYLSFIPEAQTAGEWINKDWAKIGSGCVCSGGMLAASALTASLSRRTEWREGAAELAGR